MDGANIVTAEFEGDYVAVSLERLDFTIGQERECHEVDIIDDEICEPLEDFFSDLIFGGGIQPISIEPSQTRVVIDDTDQEECGERCYNL